MGRTKLTKAESEFIERVKPLLKRFLELCEKEGIRPGAGSYVLSENNNIYHGIPFLSNDGRWIHGEENAIGTMLTEEGEKSKFKIILAVGSPKEIIMPCGMCRATIKRYSIDDATIICTNLSLTKISRFTISELYPYPYESEV